MLLCTEINYFVLSKIMSKLIGLHKDKGDISLQYFGRTGLSLQMFEQMSQLGSSVSNIAPCVNCLFV